MEQVEEKTKDIYNQTEKLWLKWLDNNVSFGIPIEYIHNKFNEIKDNISKGIAWNQQ